MITFKEIALIEQYNIDEKKMKASDLKKAKLALKKRARTPEYKAAKKKQEKCSTKITDKTKKACGMGEITPHKIDRKRSKASKIGSRSR